MRIRLMCFCTLAGAAALSEPAVAAPISFNFTAQASPDTIVNGDFNAANGGGSIAGSFSFDDSIISAALAGGQATAEYPDASIAFTLTRPSGFTDSLATESVVRTTSFPDMRLLIDQGNGRSHLHFWNLDSTPGGFFTVTADPVFITFQFAGIVAAPGDLTSLAVSFIDFRYFISPSPTNLIDFYYTNVAIGTSAQAVPEPATFLLLGFGLARLSWSRHKQWRNRGRRARGEGGLGGD